MLRSAFSRYASGKMNVKVRNIGGFEWNCLSSSGKGGLISCSGPDGPANSPPDQLEMALGVCTGANVLRQLQREGKKVNALSVDMEAVWDLGDLPRFTEIRMKVNVDAPGVTKEHVENILKKIEAEKLCFIRNTLEHAPNISLLDS